MFAFVPPRPGLPHLYVLWVFLILATWGFVLAGLGLVDAWLAATGRTTVSQYVWRWPLLGVPVVAWASLGPVFLALHFWAGLLRP